MGILTDDMKRLVREQKLGFVATVCADGTPNLSPKGSTTVWDDDHLVFADICSPGTIENLRHNQSVEINVVDPLVRKGYRFKGSASIFTEGPEFEKWLQLYSNPGKRVQSGVANSVRSIVLIKVERAIPIISPGYRPGVTEEQKRAQWEEYIGSLKRSKERATQI